MLTYKRPVDWFSVGEDIDYRFGVQGVIVPLHQSPGLEHTIYHNALTRVSQFVCSPGGSIHTTTSKISFIKSFNAIIMVLNFLNVNNTSFLLNRTN